MNKRSDCFNRGYAMRKILGVLPRPEKRTPTVKELRETEWSYDCDDVCKALMIPGAFRYGRLNQEGKPQFNRIKDAIRRLELYNSNDPNLLHLADARNLIMLEWEEGLKPGRYFQDKDDKIHTERL